MGSDTPASGSPAPLKGLHLLLTYECNFECDHCFVWGGPNQSGTMTAETIEHILSEARALGTIEWIYFEGGEAFLYYELLCDGVRKAKASGFKVGIVTNGYWATGDAEALEWLRPLKGKIDDFSLSNDGYHGSLDGNSGPEIAARAARQLGMPVDFICVAEPEATAVAGSAGKLPAGESAVLYRGRAAAVLASRARTCHWELFTECPWENLRHPGRVHVDPYGHLHICQGISIGNLLQQPLPDIVAAYDADAHPVVGPLLAGGPAELARRYAPPHEDEYADHCHLCYESRRALRQRFPDVLTPDQMYGAGS